MSRWDQPICERDWINRESTWQDAGGVVRLVSIRRPVLIKQEFADVERCSFCSEPTIFGAFVREDPAKVPYPPAEEEVPA